MAHASLGTFSSVPFMGDHVSDATISLLGRGRGAPATESVQDVGKVGLFLPFVRYSCHLDLEPALSPFESSAVLYSKCSVRVNTVLVSVCVGTHAGEKVRSIFHSAF